MQRAEENAGQQNEKHWSMDRRIQPAFLLGLLLQAVGVFWYFGTLDNRVAENKQEIAVMRSDLSKIEDQMGPSINRLVRIETILERIERSLSALEERERSRNKEMRSRP